MINFRNKCHEKHLNTWVFFNNINFCEVPKILLLLNMIKKQIKSAKKHEKKCLTLKFLLHTIKGVVGNRLGKFSNHNELSKSKLS